MRKEPACFLKVANMFSRVVGDNPWGLWVRGEAEEYKADLNRFVEDVPFIKRSNNAFTQKTLIDAYLYTQYAHQSKDGADVKYRACLDAVYNNKSGLDYLFLNEAWKCSIHMVKAGNIIVSAYNLYCDHHKVCGSVVKPIRDGNPGIGLLETKEARKRRILLGAAEQLAKDLWNKEGCPPGRHERFIQEALTVLLSEMKE